MPRTDQRTYQQIIALAAAGSGTLHSCKLWLSIRSPTRLGELRGIARLLYQDAGIVATVLDSDIASDDPDLSLLPGKVMRLFQMGPALKKQLARSSSYRELLRGYQDGLDCAVRREGFVGVKCHLAEEVGFGADEVSDSQAEFSLAAAQAGDPKAYQKLYVAIFTATLLQGQELGVPIHLHGGVTGGYGTVNGCWC